MKVLIAVDGSESSLDAVSLAGRLLQFDALAMRFRETRLSPDPACPACGPHGR